MTIALAGLRPPVATPFATDGSVDEALPGIVAGSKRSSRDFERIRPAIEHLPGFAASPLAFGLNRGRSPRKTLQ